MRKQQYEIGRLNDKPYKLRYDQRKNQHAVDYEYRNIWRWFLWVGSYYQGDFRTKKEAYEFMEQNND